MKKVLLGTTAIFAAAAFGGGAYAQDASEPIKLGLGGYWVGGGASQVTASGSANNGRLRQSFQQDSLIVVSGSTKFDNGLNAGVSVQFRGEGANSATATLQSDGKTVKGGQDTVKRSYVRFFGGFGEVRFGDDEDSRLQKAVFAPQAGAIFGVNTPFLTWSNNPIGTNSTAAPIGTKRAQRIAYFSPTIAGFSFAASYAPQDKKGNFAPLSYPTAGSAATAGQNNQNWSVAGGYDNKFGDFRLQASAGYTGSRQNGSGGPVTNAVCITATPGNAACTTASTPTANRSAWNAGLNIGFGPVQVGSSFEHQNARQSPKSSISTSGGNSNTWDAGAVYTIGPFSASLDWSRGFYKNASTVNTTNLLDVYEVIFDYVLGPGVSVGAAYQYNRFQSNDATTPNEHDSSIELGTHFTF
jgi:hypothetical protein